jgi:hypothetical protein
MKCYPKNMTVRFVFARIYTHLNMCQKFWYRDDAQPRVAGRSNAHSHDQHVNVRKRLCLFRALHTSWWGRGNMSSMAACRTPALS